MNEKQPDRSELDELRHRQSVLETELGLLWHRIGALESRLQSDEQVDSTAKPSDRGSLKERREERLSPMVRPGQIAVPPRIGEVLDSSRPEVVGTKPVRSVPAPTQLTAVPGGVPERIKEPLKPAATPLTSETPRSVPVPPPSGPEAAHAGNGSFEMRLGTYWLVRIGVVMVLTALVFFGNLAYHNFINKLGPAGKVCLLYFASFGLLGTGWWLQRRTALQKLRNYGEVLFAGGLAAVYFTTYAAHYFPNLHVIGNQVLAALLLLSWAGFMAWIADRRKSQVLAVTALALAYYSSLITHVGAFTLYSNVVLTSAGLVFLIRNRWTGVSFGSLLASFGAYAYWRFIGPEGWCWPEPGQGLWTSAAFLMAYWALHTAGVFLCRHEGFSKENRSLYATLNNACFVALFLMTMIHSRHGGLWQFLLIVGAVLLVVAGLAFRYLPFDNLTRNAYVVQGLLLVTAGLIIKFSGLQLALMLGIESVVLLITGLQRKNGVLRGGAYIAALLATGWAMDGLRDYDRVGLALALGLGILMIFNLVLESRATPEPENGSLRQPVAYFSGLAVLAISFAIWHNSHKDMFPLVIAGEGLVLTASFYVLRVRELSLLAQVCVLFGTGSWIVLASAEQVPSFEKTAPLAAILLALIHWWSRQSVLRRNVATRFALEGAYALGLVLIIYMWANPKLSPAAWPALCAGLAVLLTAYGVQTRAWLLAGAAQGLLVASFVDFAPVLFRSDPAWYLFLFPMASALVLSLGTVKWLGCHPQTVAELREPLLQVALVYRALVCLCAIAWVFKYVTDPNLVWVFAVLAMMAFVLAVRFNRTEMVVYSSTFLTIGIAVCWWHLLGTEQASWRDLSLVLALVLQQRMARRLPHVFPLSVNSHTVLIIAGSLTLWLFISRWVMLRVSGFYLTASWSILAMGLFAAGLVLRERIYRWAGLAVLAFALGRVVVFDVWKLETVYRILSFLALGVALLVLGFFYNRYQEKIRQWL